MKHLFILLVGFLALAETSFAQKWQAILEEFGQPSVNYPICNAVANGTFSFKGNYPNGYWARFEMTDTVFVNNDFAIEARVRNAEANGGITAFDTGIYLEGCDMNSGATLMGAAWALDFTSVYAGPEYKTQISSFIRDFSNWSIIRYVYHDNVFYVFQDNNLLYQLPYSKKLQFIEKLFLRFKGAGEIDWIKLYNGNAQVIWTENFDDCNQMVPFPDWRQQINYHINNDTLICRTESLQISSGSNVPTIFHWTGPNGFTSDQPTFVLNSVLPKDTGYYYLDATFWNCIQSRDSVHIGLVPVSLPPPHFLGSDTTLCLGGSLTLGEAYSCATYLWQDGSTDSTFIVNSPGKYAVSIELEGIQYNDTIQIAYYTLPQIELGNDTTLCPGETFALQARQPVPATYLWQDGSTDSVFTVRSAGLYYVQITDLCGNMISDAIKVDYYSVLTALNIGNDTTLCPGSSLVLDATDAAAITYQWQDGSTNPTFTADAPGVYFVTLTDHCGNVLTDSIQVSYFETIQSVSLGKDTTLCPGETLALDVTNTAALRYHWQDGSTNSTFIVQQPGIYKITVEDNCGHVVSDDIKVDYFKVLSGLDLGADTSLCPGNSLTLNATDEAAISYRWQDGSAQSEYTVTQPGVYAVSLSDHCGNTLNDSIEIAYYQTIKTIDIGQDTTLCVGRTQLLNASNAAAATFLWQDGSTKSSFLVDKPGIYSVTIGDHCGNFATDEVRVHYDDLPQVNLGPDTTVCEGSVYRLDASGNNTFYYYWQDGSVKSSFPVTQPGDYSVVVGNACGVNYSNVRIDFEYCGPCRTGIPNAFSPNGDNVNDQLEVFSECLFSKYDFRVFDRWGVEVFASQNPAYFWDGTFQGKPMRPGVYIWRLVYEAEDGSAQTLSGDVTLMR